MIVRDYEEADLPDLERMHEDNGFDYLMPDLTNPLVITKKVVLNDEGQIIGAAYTRIQAETFLLLDTSLDASGKVEAINAVDAPLVADSQEQGLDQLVAYLPPKLEDRFNKRLKLLGWSPARDGWKPWSLDI